MKPEIRLPPKTKTRFQQSAQMHEFSHATTHFSRIKMIRVRAVAPVTYDIAPQLG